MWKSLVVLCQLLLVVKSQYQLERSLLPRDDISNSISETLYSNLEYFAQYAGAGYCDNNEASAIYTLITCADDVCPLVQAAGAYNILEFSGNWTDQEGFVAIDPTNSLIVLSFRGSDSLDNFLYDVLFSMTPCEFGEGCQAEYGFYDSWMSVKDVVVGTVKTAVSIFPDYKLVSTGHSLGAAVAVLAGAYLRDDGYAVDIYTYGCPRVFNANGSNYVTAQEGGNYRVTHLDDPVPRLPPMFLGYTHVSPEYWLSNGTSTTNYYPISSIEICPGITNETCNAGQTDFDVTAHAHYFEAIGACWDLGLKLKKRSDNDTASNAEQKTMFAKVDIAYAEAVHRQDL